MTKQTREKWAERVREWRASGQSAGEFTAGKGYAASSLRWADSQLQVGKSSNPAPAPAPAGAKTRRPGRASPAPASSRPAPQFLPVRTRPAAPVSLELVVEVGGARIRVARGADLALIGEVVRALQAAGR